ncbi:MAG TPA: AAA family ATPase [Acidimicrobiia bacterium]|nr:AAA family ATPase [Acidimicrobiia bacterium]
MRLLERDDVLEHLDHLLSAARQGNGRAVLVRGEAGIGKTSAVRLFTRSHLDDAHVLWGGCDDLLTARPLGPIWDMALDEPTLGEALRGQDRHEVFALLFELVARVLRPTIMVIEDIHWADEATLDLVKYLGRRIDRTHGLLVLTYRDGEVPGDRPLRVALADVAASVLDRITLPPLSESAVSEMATAAGGSSDGLWEISAGNPFFLTELLASDRESVPVSIRDAVMARVARLSPGARSLVDLVAVVPSRAELDLVSAVLGPSDRAVAESEAAGVLQLEEDALSFRHELARRSVESDLPEIRRRELNLLVLRAVESLGYDLARAAHHARMGGHVDSLLRLAPLAARRAAEMESHSEAVAHLRTLEPYLDRLDAEMCADHYDLWAYEEYLGNENTRAEEIIETGISFRRRLGDPAKLGNSLLIASRIAWVRNRRASAVELANEAATVLEAVGGHDLAFAYSTISQLAMLASDEERTLEYADKAMATAGDGPSEARAHALNNIGAVKMGSRFPEGMEEVEQSFAMSAQLGFSHEQMRAAVNIGWSALCFRELDTAATWVARAHDLAMDREIASFEAYAVVARGLISEMRGDWADAEANAVYVLENLELATARMVANSLLGRLQARTGHPEAKNHLLEGWEPALQTGEIQRTAPAGSSMAEFVWIGGALDRDIFPRLREVLAESLQRDPTWRGGELAFWLHMIGEIDQPPPGVAEPYRLAMEGEWEKVASFWAERGMPYDRAVALSQGSTEAKLEGLTIFDELGAAPLASRLRSELAAAGVSGVPRGPTRATRENPFGLTPRQMDVLGHMAGGMTNAEIADRLFVSSRTVDHHVSAILGKLGASTRAEAVVIGRDAGLFDR